MTTDRIAHLRAALLDAALDPTETEEWLVLADSGDPERLLRAATDWAWEGVPAHDAVRWFEGGWEPRASVIWWMLGFTPSQATFVSDRLAVLGLNQAQIKEWLFSSLIADDIVLFLAAGVSTIEEAQTVYAQCNSDASLRGSLTMRAASGGIDVRGLKAS